MSVQRVKYLNRVIDQRAGNDQPPLLAVSIHQGVIRRDTLTDGLPRAEDLSNYKLCEPGDIVLNRMRAFQGAIGVSPQRGLVSPDYAVLRPSPEADVRYLHHLFRSTWFVGEMISRLRGIGNTENGAVRTPRINPEDLGDIAVDFPSLDEQRRIADFLDAETARIDALLDARRSQLELLVERRFALIRELLQFGTCVGAPLQETGINWLPKCPATWQLNKLRLLSQCLDGKRIPLSAEERATRKGEYPYYGASTIVDYVDDYLFDEEFVLLGEDGAQLGNPNYEISSVVNGKIWVNNHAHVLRPIGINASLLAAILNIFDRELCMSGSTREKITQDAMNALLIPVPPTNEQAALEQALTDRRTAQERVERGIREQVDLLAERRQALITAAVTGGIAV